MIGVALTAFAVVFLAELGDKTQLVALGFGARGRLSHVVAGVVAAYVITTSLSVLAGQLLGSVLESGVINVIGGVLFLVFGLAALRGTDDDDEMNEGPAAAQRSALSFVFSVCAAMVIAELGDKTMLATATLAARGDAVAVWIGSFAGITGAGLVGVAVGRLVGKRLPQRALRIGSGLLFIVFGLLLLFG